MLRERGRTPPVPLERLDMLFPFAAKDKYPRLEIAPIERDDAAELIADASLVVER